MTELETPPQLAAAMEGSGDNIVDIANAVLAAQGSDYQIAQVEFITDDPDAASSNIIIASDRGNKRLAIDFIPDDPRRGGADGDPNTIDTWIDQVDGNSNGVAEPGTTAAIASAMTSWDDQRCSDLSTSVIPVPADLGLVQFIFGFGGGLAVSDLMHAGWLPGAFFDLLAPGGSSFILGATFTLTFTTGDLDGDGQADLAAREIYYNDAYTWSTSGGGVDVESIALHEAGHGLSQAHFGKVFIGKNGKLHFAPRAVMNAVYSGVSRSITGTDRGGHCGLWGSWPNN